MIDSLFGQLAEWASKPRWSGAGFTRVVVELADLRGHPARAIARRHKASVEAWLTSRLTAAGIAAPRERAREVALLMEGAMMLMLIHGDVTYAKSAADAAKRLVQKKRGKPANYADGQRRCTGSRIDLSTRRIGLPHSRASVGFFMCRTWQS
jgi:hypothetical protein